MSVSEELRNLNPGSTSPATIEFLINAGADPDLRNSSGFTFREIVRWTYEYERGFVDPVDRRIPEAIFALVR